MPRQDQKAFSYRAGVLSRKPTLHCGSVAISRLAEKHGTPLYVYSADLIRDRYASFGRAFRNVPHTVCYSVKANSNLSILRLLAKLGAGFDVVSGGELERVLRVDKRAAAKVVFSGVGKTVAEMEAGIRADILMFNVESESELWALEACAKKLKKFARIAFRVNPDVSASTHPYIATGLQKHKFGVPIEDARELYRRAHASEWLDVVGVSTHIGSQITDVSPFRAAMSRVAELVRSLRKDGMEVRYVDAGGGLGITYEHNGDGPSQPDFRKQVTEYAKAVTEPLRGLGLHVLLEPGRAIVGPAGVLVTRVLYLKNGSAKRFAVVDAGYNDLIRPTLYGAHHDIVPVVRNRGAEETLYDVVGPVCETGDFFARDRSLPAMSEGDLIAILDAGAYGMSIASNYNTRLKPAEVLVDGGKVRVIRRRESIDDLLRNEL